MSRPRPRPPKGIVKTEREAGGLLRGGFQEADAGGRKSVALRATIGGVTGTTRRTLLPHEAMPGAGGVEKDAHNCSPRVDVTGKGAWRLRSIRVINC